MSFFDRFFASHVDEVQTLKAEVSLGYEFRAWAESNVGRYIIGKAEQRELEVLRELSNADATDEGLILKLQAEAKAPKLLIRWIEEAIFAGEQANFQLMELDE